MGIKISRSLAFLSIALLPAFVNGGEHSTTGKNPGSEVKTSTAIVSFGGLIQEVIAAGKHGVFEGITRFPEIPKQTPVRIRWVPGKATMDAHQRWFTVILDISTATVKPTFVELFVEEKDIPASISNQYSFLLGLDGVLRQGGLALARLDEKGKAISGPALAPFKYLDIKAPETRARLKRELDFWLKGIGRKPPPPPSEK